MRKLIYSILGLLLMFSCNMREGTYRSFNGHDGLACRYEISKGGMYVSCLGSGCPLVDYQWQCISSKRDTTILDAIASDNGQHSLIKFIRMRDFRQCGTDVYLTYEKPSGEKYWVCMDTIVRIN